MSEPTIEDLASEISQEFGSGVPGSASYQVALAAIIRDRQNPRVKVLRLPRACSTRYGATELVATFEGDLAGTHIVADAHGVAAAAQGWCDEFVKQIVEVRGAHLLIYGADAGMREDIERAARLRGFSNRVIVDAPLGATERKDAVRPDPDTARKGLEGPFEPWESDHTALVRVLWHAKHEGLTLERDADEIARLIRRSRYQAARDAQQRQAGAEGA